MREILVIYHSRTGGTLAMVQALVQGAHSHSSACSVRLLPAQDTQPHHLLQADGYVFACPENLAAISGTMKECLDRCYYALLDQLQGRPYAAMVCAGSDGHNAARQLARIATGWRLQAIAPPLIVCTHAQTPVQIAAPKQLDAEQYQACHALGGGFASGLEMGIF